MAKLIHGEIKLPIRMMGQASDLFSILLTAGYTLEVKLADDFAKPNNEIIFTIMTEVE
jgi:hypothetical protein